MLEGGQSVMSPASIAALFVKPDDMAALFAELGDRVIGGYLAHIKPCNGPADDHALDLGRALENGEARGGPGSFRR